MSFHLSDKALYYINRTEGTTQATVLHLTYRYLCFNEIPDMKSMEPEVKFAFGLVADELNKASARSQRNLRYRLGASSKTREENESGEESSSPHTPYYKEEGKAKEECTPPSPSASYKTAEMFAEFWDVYPRKVAKADAFKAFVSVMKTERNPRGLLDKMKSAVREQSASVDWVKDGGKFIPYPATWLRAARWEDEMCQGLSLTGTEGSALAASLVGRMTI